MKIIAITAVILAISFVLLANYQKHQTCLEKAQEEAIMWYDVNSYPDTTERSHLQEEFKNRYIQQHCK